MFETHPYLIRDESDRRSAVFQAKSDSKDPAKGLPGDPWFSEPLARKRLVGQITKRYEELKQWYEDSGLTWKPGEGIDSWVYKFSKFAKKTDYYGNLKAENVKESRSLREIGEASNPKGFVAYIYADGNNMGGYIQKIKTPQEYRQFSKDIFDATEKSVYQALAKHLKPYKYKPDAQSSRQNKDEVLIHPFEILTIGGDDVMLIVPANKALEIAKPIGEAFEKYLSEIEEYKIAPRCFYHRYYPAKAKGNVGANGSSPLPNDKFSQESRCQLSMSTGVLIAAENK